VDDIKRLAATVSVGADKQWFQKMPPPTAKSSWSPKLFVNRPV
jgi:hypothetical protein